jgi:hypothetical protein
LCQAASAVGAAEAALDDQQFGTPEWLPDVIVRYHLTPPME